MSSLPPVLVLAASPPTTTPIEPAASAGVLITAALVGIVVIIGLITALKFSPFIALTIGSVVVAAIAGVAPTNLLTSFTTGFGNTLGGIATLIALGSIIGTVLVQSGGANLLVDRLLSRSPKQLLPWMVALVAFIVGIPLFFEIGIVLLIPIVMLVARRAKVPVLFVGIPMVASLGQLHALLPPHPGPLALVQALDANLGLTMLFGFLTAIPIIIILGPLMAPVWARLAPVYADDSPLSAETVSVSAGSGKRVPRLGWVLTTVLLPVVLMLANTVSELTLDDKQPVAQVLAFIGAPFPALLIAALCAIFALGYGTHHSLSDMSKMVGSSFAPIAGILLIVGAGGGFKQTLVDLGIGQVVADGASSMNVSPLLVAWSLAAMIRIATGSSTVAALTAAGLALPLAAGLDPVHTTFMVLALGAGSGFLSHVNDAGFWLIKEFFGLSVWQTFKTWTLFSILGPLIGLGLISILWVAVP